MKNKNINKNKNLKEFEIKEKKKQAFVNVSLLQEEREEMIKLSKKYNLTLSAYLRKCHNFYRDYIKNLKK